MYSACLSETVEGEGGRQTVVFLVHHKYAFKGSRFNKERFNKVNFCTNQNEILMTQIQNNQKSIGKSIQANGYLKSQEKPKVLRLLSYVYNFKKESQDCGKENHIQGYEFKNLQKIFSLAHGFFFFVVSISGINDVHISSHHPLDC